MNNYIRKKVQEVFVLIKKFCVANNLINYLLSVLNITFRPIINLIVLIVKII